MVKILNQTNLIFQKDPTHEGPIFRHGIVCTKVGLISKKFEKDIEKKENSELEHKVDIKLALQSTKTNIYRQIQNLVNKCYLTIV